MRYNDCLVILDCQQTCVRSWLRKVRWRSRSSGSGQHRGRQFRLTLGFQDLAVDWSLFVGIPVQDNHTEGALDKMKVDVQGQVSSRRGREPTKCLKLTRYVSDVTHVVCCAMAWMMNYDEPDISGKKLGEKAAALCLRSPKVLAACQQIPRNSRLE